VRTLLFEASKRIEKKTNNKCRKIFHNVVSDSAKFIKHAEKLDIISYFRQEEDLKTHLSITDPPTLILIEFIDSNKPLVCN